jgi:hypothetical protein
MKQEVRLQVDVSLTIDAKHDREAVRQILERGIRQMFPNNHKVYNSASFAEEADIYRPRNDRIRHDGIKWERLWERFEVVV